VISRPRLAHSPRRRIRVDEPHSRTSLSVFVSGAGAGIGKAVVERLAAYGFRVFAGVRGASTNGLYEAALGVTPVFIDFTDEEQVARGAAEISMLTGPEGLRGLVNAAGLIAEGPLELVTVSRFRQ